MDRFITDIPNEARILLKETVDSDGRIKDEKGALSALSEYIIKYAEPYLISEMCSFLCGRDLDKTLEKTEEIFSSDPEFSYSERRFLVEDSLEKCLNENETTNFKGFLRFRLSEYKDLVFLGVNIALSELVIEERYEETVSVLKDYVKMSKSLVKEAHIYGYGVFDKDGNELSENNKALSFEDFFTAADRLIGTLIYFCPEKIYIHVPPDGGTTETIEKIFSPNVIYG